MNGGGLPSPQASSHPGVGVSGRVAAVCPYIQVPAEGRQDGGCSLPADPPPKPTPLCHIRSLSGWWPYLVCVVRDFEALDKTFSIFGVFHFLNCLISNFLSVSFSCLLAPLFPLSLSVIFVIKCGVLMSLVVVLCHVPLLMLWRLLL